MVRVLLSDQTGYLGANLAQRYAASEHELVTVDWDNEEAYTAAICEETDIIVVDLVRDLAKANKVLNVLSTGTWEEPKTLVAVSSLLTWNETKTKKNKPLTEADFKNRKCTPRFKELKIMETLVLNAAKENLVSLVVAPGIMYGAQQDVFGSIFRDAWMSNKDALTCLGEGTNVLPVIHVKDTAAYIEKVSTAPPEGKQYLVAIDNTDLTQKQILETISKGLGTGNVTTSTELGEDLEDGIAQVLISNMKFDRESLHLSSADMEWHNEKFDEGFEKVRAEFVEGRKLTPLRVSVIGPPGAGKTHYAKLLAEKYYLPHVSVGDVIKEALAGNDELAAEANASLAEQANASGGKGGKGKKKAAPKKGKGKGKADERPRLPPAILAKIIRKKLLSAPCRNKGFVLDGFPRTAQEASALFEIKAEGEEEAPPAEEGEEGEERKVNFDPAVMCKFVISLETTKDAAQARLQNTSEDEAVAGHNDEEGFQRRWGTYEYVCDDKAEGPSEPLAFFKGVEVLEIPQDISASADTGFATMSKYVEAGGKVFNFHPTPKEQVEEKERQDKEAREAAEKAKAVAEQKEEEERQLRSEQAAQDSERRSNVLEEDRQMVEEASVPLRKYLMKNVIPKLVDGLLDVCQTQPEDPIDYLAEYLFEHATVASN